MAACFSCNLPLDLEREISRTETCPQCGADVHCCKNCRHHDPAAHNQCREPNAEWVADRDKANFCDYFQLAASGDSGGRPAGASARAAFDALFKKKS